jgi:hypothetical protein
MKIASVVLISGMIAIAGPTYTTAQAALGAL